MSDEEELVLSETTETFAELVGAPLDSGRVVRPGDHLVVSVDDLISAEQMAHLRSDLLGRFPGIAAVTVLGRTRFEFVYRDDEDDEP